MNKLIGRILVFFALFIVLLQAFSVPIIAVAAQPWSGSPWSGNSWSGEGWTGSPWEGSPWSVDSFEGHPWEGNGNGSNGNGWDGTSWSTAPWTNNGWNTQGNQGGNGWTNNGWNTQGNQGGNGWTNNGWNSQGSQGGNGSANNGWNTQGNQNSNGWNNNGWNSQGNQSGNGWNGQGGNGNPWNNPNFATNPLNPLGPNLPMYFPSSGSGGSGSGSSGNVDTILNTKLPFGYEVAKYIGNDVIGGQVNMIGDYMLDQNNFRPNGTFFSTLLLNGVKVGLGDKTPWYINGASEAQDVITKGKDAFDAAHDIKVLRNARNATEAAANARGAITGLKKVGAISKFNVAASAIGAGYGAFETGFNTAKAVDVIKSDAKTSQKVSAVADATASLGDTLMNAGVVAAAIPGGQTAGAIMIAGGAVIWGASKLTKLVADNVEFFKHPVKNTKKAISKGWKKIKGWFS